MERKYTAELSPALLIGSIAFLLAMCGLLTIISSQSAAAMPFYLASRQLLSLAAAFAVFGIASLLPFNFYRKWRRIAGVGGVLLLLLLLIPGGGIRVNGMCGWFRMGSWTFQPSELVKFSYLLALPPLMLRREQPEYRRLGWSAFCAVCWILPVVLQPDFGTAAVYGGTFLLLWFISGGSWLSLGGMLVTASAAAAAAVWRYPYIQRRLAGFISPETDPQGSGWHLRQFEFTIARGGTTGAKLGGAVWSNNYLPLSYNDSVFATMIETAGIIGGGLSVLLLVVLIWVLARYPLKYSAGVRRDAVLAAAGCTIMIALQSLIHLSVNAGLLPPTGLPWPLVSYGGSSLVGTMLILGVAASAAKEILADSAAVSHQM